MKDLRSALFEQAVGTVLTVDQAQNKITFKSTALLNVSSCFGYHEASLLLASIHLSGLGQSVNQQQVESLHAFLILYINCYFNITSVIMTENIDDCVFQGHVYSLIGALGDNRFTLMHAGYKHTQGIDGYPKDLDMAYSYYSNAAAQSNIDSYRIHENEVYFEFNIN